MCASFSFSVFQATTQESCFSLPCITPHIQPIGEKSQFCPQSVSPVFQLHPGVTLSTTIVVFDSLQSHGGTPWVTYVVTPHSLPGFSVSVEFSQQECWSGVPCPPPGDLPDPGIKLMSPATLALQGDSLLLSHQESPIN